MCFTLCTSRSGTIFQETLWKLIYSLSKWNRKEIKGHAKQLPSDDGSLDAHQEITTENLSTKNEHTRPEVVARIERQHRAQNYDFKIIAVSVGRQHLRFSDPWQMLIQYSLVRYGRQNCRVPTGRELRKGRWKGNTEFWLHTETHKYQMNCSSFWALDNLCAIAEGKRRAHKSGTPMHTNENAGKKSAGNQQPNWCAANFVIKMCRGNPDGARSFAKFAWCGYGGLVISGIAAHYLQMNFPFLPPQMHAAPLLAALSPATLITRSSCCI